METTHPLGSRLREARLALGLTQTQAAEGIVSGAFLSLIESGHRTPSSRVAAALASRLRLSLDAVDASAASTVNLEVALRLGDWRTAQQHLIELDEGSAEHAFYEGQIAHQQGDFPRALRLLDAAALATGASSALRARARVALCRCARSGGDLYRSIEVGERALAEMQADPHADPDIEAELRATLAGTYCETGDLLRAQELTEPAARVDDPWLLATQRWSRAMVMQTTGEFAEARALAFEALELLQTLDRPRSAAQLQNTAAWIAMQTPRFDATQISEMLQDSERTFRSTHADIDLALALSSKAELAVRVGDRDSALACIDEALALVSADNSGLRARITAIAAQILAAAGSVNASMQRLLEARALLESSGAKRSAAGTWRHMAQTYEELGEIDLTVACLKAATDLLGLRPPLQAPVERNAPEVQQRTRARRSTESSARS